MTAEPADDATWSGTEGWNALAAWAAEELGVAIEFDGKVYRVVKAAAPAGAPARRKWFGWVGWVGARIQPDSSSFVAPTPVELLDGLLQRLRNRADAPDTRPMGAPATVQDVSARLLAPYRLDGGQAHLAECVLEDVPLVRLTWVRDADDGLHAEHRYFDELGAPIPWREVEQLGGDRIESARDAAPPIDRGRRQRMLGSADHAVQPESPELATIVWGRRARGVVRIELGDQSLEAPFDGWERSLASPAVVCPQTGVATHSLSTLSDGSIAAAEEIGICAVSLDRVLRRDLVRCSLTGISAGAEHLAPCGASGRPVLRSQLAPCERCGLAVAPPAKHAGGCDGCRSANPVAASDPRLAAIVARYPQLGRWRWALAETPSAYVLRSRGGLWRRVVTLDRETLGVIHSADAPPWSRRWRSRNQEL